MATFRKPLWSSNVVRLSKTNLSFRPCPWKPEIMLEIFTSVFSRFSLSVLAVTPAAVPSVRWQVTYMSSPCFSYPSRFHPVALTLFLIALGVSAVVTRSAHSRALSPEARNWMASVNLPLGGGPRRSTFWLGCMFSPRASSSPAMVTWDVAA